MAWVKELPYFPASELACKGSGVIKIDDRFAAMLPALRVKWGEPLTPSSVCRTPAHNVKVDGHPTSFHLTENPKYETDGTMSADITWLTWPTAKKLKFARLAYEMGFAVGLHNSFCHIDYRIAVGLAQQVFLYGTWGNQFTPAQVSKP